MKLTDVIVWYDQSAWWPLKQRIERAVCHYEQKFGQPPTSIFLHESELAEEVELFGVAVRPAANVLNAHFTIGIEKTGGLSV